MAIDIQIDDQALREALGRLLGAVQDPRAALQDIGELMVARTKGRFATSTGPDGRRWEENADATLLRYLDARTGSYTKKGRLSAKGARRLGSKRPLIGESKRLSREISYRVDGGELAIGSPLIYAATHQFGAAARSFTGGRAPWGDIPARPFLGVSESEGREILDILREHLVGA